MMEDASPAGGVITAGLAAEVAFSGIADDAMLRYARQVQPELRDLSDDYLRGFYTALWLSRHPDEPKVDMLREMRGRLASWLRGGVR